MYSFIKFLFVLSLLQLSATIFAQVYDDQPDWSSSDDAFTMTIAVGDIDKNGTLEIVAGNYGYPYTKSTLSSGLAGNINDDDFGGYLVIYWNGTSDPDTIENTKRGYDKVILVDLDNDDTLDIVTGCVNLKGGDGSNYYFIYENGDYGTGETFSSDPKDDTHDLAAGDINNDGFMDVISAGVRGETCFWTGDTSALDMAYNRINLNLRYFDFDYEWGSDQLPGSVVELGDIDRDGRLDLYLNFEGNPTIYQNTGDPPYFNTSTTISASHKEASHGASFGWIAQDTLGLAIITRSHNTDRTGGSHEKLGGNIYALDDNGSLKEIYRFENAVLGSDTIYQLTSDIQWGDIDDDGGHEIVTSAYPTLCYDASTLDWCDGHGQYWSLNSISYNNVDTTDNYPDWSSSISDLSTSLALGDLDCGELESDYLEIDSTSWADDSRCYYFEHFPLYSVDSVNAYFYGGGWHKINRDTVNYCYHLRNGWISFCDTTTLEYSGVRVYYRYSNELDLVVGNDGYNFAYTNGSTTGSYSGPSPYSVSSIPTSTRTAGGPFTLSRMEQAGAIGGLITEGGGEGVAELSYEAPDVNLITHWFFYNDIEDYRGHYYWDYSDKIVDEAFDHNIRVCLFADGAGHQQWTYPQNDYPDSLDHPVDEKYIAFFTRNLVNRYRDGGVLDDKSTSPYGNYDTDEGVKIYIAENEPNDGELGTPAYTKDINALREKLKYNYGMIKDIDSDFLVGSPQFKMGKKEVNGDTIAYPTTAYLDSLYSDSPSDNTLDYALRKYTDIVLQQFYCFSDIVSDEAVYKDPATNTICEDILACYDSLFYANADSDKYLMSVEWLFEDWLTQDLGLSNEERLHWSLTQRAEMFSSDRFLMDCGGYLSPDSICEGINQQARALKGCRYEGYYPQAVTNDTVKDYLFRDPSGSDARYVHQIRSISASTADTVRISIHDANISTPLDNSPRATLAFANGNEWEREYGQQSGLVHLKYYPSEIDATVQWMTETDNYGDVKIEIELFPGQWRLISSNIVPGDLDLNVVFSDVDTCQVKDYQNNTWPNGFLDEWVADQGFLVGVPDDTTLQYLAIEEYDYYGPDSYIDITTSTQDDTTIHVRSFAYNRYYISYLPTWSMPVDSAFKVLIDADTVTWIRNTEGQFYFPDHQQYSTNFLCMPGEGYDLNMDSSGGYEDFYFTTETGFIPDWNSGGKETEPENEIESIEPVHFSFKKYTQDVYPIIIDTLSIQGVDIEANDEIAVFTEDDICCGAKVLENGEDGLLLTAWQDDIMTEVKDGFEIGEEITFKYFDASLDTEYVIEPTYTLSGLSPEQLSNKYASYSGTFGSKHYALENLHFDGPEYEVPRSYALYQNYPNPFNPTTVVKFDLPYHSEVKLEVFNVLGQKVATLMDGIMQAGYRSVNWHGCSESGAELASGLYIYRINAQQLNGKEKFASVKKMVLIK